MRPFKLLLTATTCFPELLPLTMLYLSIHTIGYNARVELSLPLREKAPLNICFNSGIIPNRTAASC